MIKKVLRFGIICTILLTIFLPAGTHLMAKPSAPADQPDVALAACSARLDWPLYTVAIGDTLYSISRRFNTSSAALANANCLLNSRIYAGQQLHVPASAAPVPNNPPSGSSAVTQIIVFATYQQFQNGFMIWRGDSGFIWAFANNGQVFLFNSSDYGSLPDNPYYAPPRGLFRPIFGFGKVWGNNASVRNALGWATRREQGFALSVALSPARDYYVLGLPSGRSVQVSRTNRWTYFTGAITQPPLSETKPNTLTGKTYAAFQPYQNGYMIWRADTEVVLVLRGTNGGQVNFHGITAYSYLPDNPIFGQPPAGLVRPINAFGRIWGNMGDVRQSLGWASGTEQGYTLTYTIKSGTPITTITVPGGRTVTINGNSWKF